MIFEAIPTLSYASGDCNITVAVDYVSPEETLYQLAGSLNGVAGRFEWIIQDGSVTHRMFIQGGTMNGVPIIP